MVTTRDGALESGFRGPIRMFERRLRACVLQSGQRGQYFTHGDADGE